jgi:hypothetical protein
MYLTPLAPLMGTPNITKLLRGCMLPVLRILNAMEFAELSGVLGKISGCLGRRRDRALCKSLIEGWG